LNALSLAPARVLIKGGKKGPVPLKLVNQPGEHGLDQGKVVDIHISSPPPGVDIQPTIEVRERSFARLVTRPQWRVRERLETRGFRFQNRQKRVAGSGGIGAKSDTVELVNVADPIGVEPVRY